MRITIFVSALSGGGAERVVCNLANYLTGAGHEIDIITMSEADPAEILHWDVTHVPLLLKSERGHSLMNNSKRIFRLAKYMKRQNVDAYVAFLPTTIMLMLRLRWLTKAPIIASERCDPEQYMPKTKNGMKKWSSKASGFVFQTEDAKAWYMPYLKGVESVIIPNAINPAFIRPKYDGKKEKTIVGAGRLNEQKNFPLLIRAFARVADKFPGHKLVIYGKGPLLESLKDLAAKLGVGNRVEFPGFCTNMPEVLEKASMFVLSSDYEGMPNALMEAMASGLPCVSTDCGGGGARFLIENGENGILVPQRDEDALAAAMEKILSDESFAEKLGNNARKLQKTLAPEKIYGEWEAFILKKVNKE